MASDEDDDDFAGGAADNAVHLRSQFAAAVGTILDGHDGLHCPPSTAFAQQLTEVAYQWATTALAPDLEAFQRHSGRKQIGAEDVLLAGRKNETTHDLLVAEAERLRRSMKESAAAKKAPK